MKGLKKALAVVLCMLLMLTPLATVAETVTVLQHRMLRLLR